MPTPTLELAKVFTAVGCLHHKGKKGWFAGFLACIKKCGPALENSRAMKPCPKHGTKCNGTDKKCAECMSELDEQNKAIDWERVRYGA